MGSRPFSGLVRLTALRPLTLGDRRIERYQQFTCPVGLAARLIETRSAEHNYPFNCREQRAIELALRLRALEREAQERHETV